MKIFIGKVISKNMEKTATVAVERVVIHPFYKKRVKKVKNYHVHDDLDVEVNQNVKFVACKPYSKTKKWKIIGIIGIDDKTVPSPKKKEIKKKVNRNLKSPIKKIIRKKK